LVTITSSRVKGMWEGESERFCFNGKNNWNFTKYLMSEAI
jgi:hypothetical protein